VLIGSPLPKLEKTPSFLLFKGACIAKSVKLETPLAAPRARFLWGLTCGQAAGC
jgi:hypothetical protein